MKEMSKLFIVLIGIFITVSCNSTKVINPNNIPTEELSVLTASDLAINIHEIDGEVMPRETHSIMIEPGEHKITLSYHQVGESNYAIVNLINMNATFSAPKTYLVTLLPGRKYIINYSINILTNDVKYSFVPLPATDAEYIINDSSYSLKKVVRPDNYKPILDVYEFLPTEKDFEILGFVKYTLNSSGFHYKNISDEEILYLIENEMKEKNIEFDAIGYTTKTYGTFPAYHMRLEALALKYKK